MKGTLVAAPTTTIPEALAPPASAVTETAAAPAAFEPDLSGAPALRPPKTFRMRERVALWKRVLAMSDRLQALGADESGEVALSGDNPEALDVIAEIDELLEEYAVSPEAYAAWATEEGGGPDLEGRVTALFGRYAEQLGESAPSTT